MACVCNIFRQRIYPFHLINFNIWTMIGIQLVCFVCMCAYCFMGYVVMKIDAWLLSAPVVVVCVSLGLNWGKGLLRIMAYTPWSHCQPGTAVKAVMSDSDRISNVPELF